MMARTTKDRTTMSRQTKSGAKNIGIKDVFPESEDEGNIEDSDDYDEEEEDDNDDDDDFGKQSSSSSDEDGEESDDLEETNLQNVESESRAWTRRSATDSHATSTLLAEYLHTDDLSSDDEENIGDNTIGRVPLHWYNAYDHIGYTIDGKKLIKGKGPDRIDLTLRSANKNGLHSIYDMLYNNREVQLSDRDLEIIRRMQMGAFAHPEHNDTPEYSDYASSIKEVMPLSAAPEPKRRFVPSKWEMMRVMKILKAIKEGKYTFSTHKKAAEGGDSSGENNLMIWNEEADEVKLINSLSNCFFSYFHTVAFMSFGMFYTHVHFGLGFGIWNLILN
jgi:ribosome biogenesis protein ERB1